MRTTSQPSLARTSLPTPTSEVAKRETSPSEAKAQGTPTATTQASSHTQRGARAMAHGNEAMRAQQVASLMAQSPSAANVTGKQIRAIVPSLSAAQADALAPHLNTAMQEAGINSPARKAAFIAQVAHESGGFHYNEEIASGAAYEGRTDLGNTQPGDGRRYKGRGYIQLTGRDNYTQASKDLGIDLVNHPELAAQPENAARVAAWFWKKNDLNTLADQGNFDGITRRINGGYNGKADRDAYHAVASKVLAGSDGLPTGSAPQAAASTPSAPLNFDDVAYMRPPFAEGATLDIGSEDPAVAEVQRHLRALGYDAPTTGVFDDATKAAVGAYQKDNKLTPPPGMEGVVGATTLNFLRSAIDTPTLDGVRNGATMQLGASGASVLELQKMLGFGAGGQTGVLGPTTLRALADFQKAQGLDAVGTLNAETLERLQQRQLTQPAAANTTAATHVTASAFDGTLSAKGQQQMEQMLAHAKNHSAGVPPDGRCYFHVANYIDALGYGDLTHIGSQLPGDKLGLARHFAEHMNAPGNADKAGLQRIDNAMSPPIQSPYDPRIPPGAIVVVPPGVPGTAHPTAGDIAIADGTGRFFNGGEMGYGGAAGYPQGKLLGIYIPQ